MVPLLSHAVMMVLSGTCHRREIGQVALLLLPMLPVGGVVVTAYGDGGGAVGGPG
jgi:hypothetical protein